MMVAVPAAVKVTVEQLDWHAIYEIKSSFKYEDKLLLLYAYAMLAISHMHVCIVSS